MRKILVFLCTMFICTLCFAETKNLTWITDDTTYATSTCEVGNDLIIPQTNPTKYGYHFMGWEKTEYLFLEYIESTGTQYISTGIRYADGDSMRAVTDAQFTNMTGSQFFGIYASAYTGVNQGHFVIGGYSVATADANRHSFDLFSNIGGKNTVTLKVDNTVYTHTRDTNSGAFQILGLNGTNLCSVKLYSIKLYKNDILVMDAVPAKRNRDKAIGMYDTVSGTFFENSGTGTFVEGPLKR